MRETVGGHDALLGEKSSEPYYLAFNKVEVEGAEMEIFFTIK